MRYHANAESFQRFAKRSESRVVHDRMKGSLTDQPLAELIREMSSKGFSGTLRLEHDRAQTAVYFDHGRVVFAASNLRTLRLREYLKKRALVPEKELDRVGTNLSDLRLASALRANGTLEQERIDGLLATLVADVLRVALLWTEGTWDFDERARLGEPVSVAVDAGSLLREAAQRMPLKFVALRFRNPSEMFSRGAEISRINNFLPAESFILSRLDQPTKLEELVALSGLRELDAQRVLYGLTLSGLVKREYWQNAFRTDQGKTSKEKTVVEAAPEISAAKTEAVDNRWAAVNEKEELETFFDRLSKATNYYEVIDLPPTAESNEIKDAYYALARRYHPDRFHLKSGTSLHAKISSAFARITQAYETLTDQNARSNYDLALERSRQFSDSAPKSSKAGSVSGATDEFEFAMGSSEEFGQAEHYFREGFGALQQGQFNVAMTHLAAASRLAPHEPRYRAYYGRALAANEQTRRLAEGEIQAAVKLEPSNPLYRTMLAELYFDLKFHRRAQTELQRALALDPNNASARALARKLEKSRKAG